MIYFSDLDRTLIYSNKFINEETKHVCVEVIDNEEISYMSPLSIEKLKRVIEIKKFIPTTTRSIEQYKRIQFKKQDINFEWSIVTNGGNILHNGEIFEPWKKELELMLNKCESLESVVKEFDKYKNIEGITKVREVDDIFFYIVVDKERFDESSLDEFDSYLKDKKWTLYINGRKIYFIPSVVTKENAIKYLVKYLNDDSYGALGDSIMDFNMLKNARKGFIPANSYLADYEKAKSMFISNSSGFQGIEEILDEIYLDA